MKRLAALLLLLAAPTFAASDGEVTVLRGTPAPPAQPRYEPPPPPKPVVIYQPVVYPQYFYVLPPIRQHPHTHSRRR